MKNPTIQELMEYTDGTLDPSRYQEIENLIAHSKKLQNEVAMLKAMGNTVRAQRISPSKKFTANIMNEILPQRHESLWFRIAKNSSGIFAMIIVLSMIGIALFASSHTAPPTVNKLSTAFESFSNTYTSAVNQFSDVMNEYTKPVNGALKTTSGKMLLLGVVIFSFFIIIDEVIGKRMTIRKQ